MSPIQQGSAVRFFSRPPHDADEEAVRAWSPELVARCAGRQREILHHASLSLKPGGLLIYSTCTFSPEENEMNVLSFLKAHREFSLMPCREEVIRVTKPGIDLPGSGGIDLSLCRRYYPFGPQGGEGQFIAVMRKSDETPAPRPLLRQAREALSAAEKSIVYGFLNEALTEFDEADVFKKGESIRYFRPDFSPDLPMFSCGINLGAIENRRFKPAHQLFSALGADFRRKIDLSQADERLGRYLRGETIFCPGEADGWAAVLVEGVPLGGAKLVRGTAKNHYPRGLREMG